MDTSHRNRSSWIGDSLSICRRWRSPQCHRTIRSHTILSIRCERQSRHTAIFRRLRHASQIRRGRECDRGLTNFSPGSSGDFGGNTGHAEPVPDSNKVPIQRVRRLDRHPASASPPQRKSNTTPMAIALEPRLNGKAPRIPTNAK